MLLLTRPGNPKIMNREILFDMPYSFVTYLMAPRSAGNPPGMETV